MFGQSALVRSPTGTRGLRALPAIRPVKNSQNVTVGKLPEYEKLKKKRRGFTAALMIT